MLFGLPPAHHESGFRAILHTLDGEPRDGLHLLDVVYLVNHLVLKNFESALLTLTVECETSIMYLVLMVVFEAANESLLESNQFSVFFTWVKPSHVPRVFVSTTSTYSGVSP